MLTTLQHLGGKLKCQLNTAAARNVISHVDYMKLRKPQLSPSDVTLVTYDGGEMKSRGRIQIKFEELSHSIPFEVIDTKIKPYPLLGIKACLELKAVKLS